MDTIPAIKSVLPFYGIRSKYNRIEDWLYGVVYTLRAIAGLNAALKWIADIGIDYIFEKEQFNHSCLIDVLSKYDNIKTVFCPQDKKLVIGVVSCVFDGYASDNIGKVLSDKGVVVRTGLHCSSKAHQFMEVYPVGTVRFSVGYFNTDEDFGRF